MIDNVTQELERYGEYADAVAPAITTDEIRRRDGERVSAPTGPRRAFPNWAVAVGAAVAVFVLIGGFVWLVSGIGTEFVDEPAPVDDGFSTVVGPDASVQFAVSLARTPDGNPLVLFMAEPQDRAVLVACDDEACGSFTETVVVEFGLPESGQVSEIAIGADGLPVFAFTRYDEDTRSTEAGIVHCLDVACTRRSVADVLSNAGGGMGPVFAVDPQGLPIAVFSDWGADGQTGVYHVVRCGDPSCQDHTVASIADAGGTPVVRFAESGSPVLAFVRNRSEDRKADLVMHACADDSCSSVGTATVVTEVSLNGHPLDMTYTADGFPVFAFDTPRLAVALCSDAACTGPVGVSFVDTGVEEARVIAIGPNGFPMIAYTSMAPEYSRELRVAACADMACSEGTIQVVDTHDWMNSIDMVIDPTGQPVLAYQTGSGLKITACGDPYCESDSQNSLSWDQASFVSTAPAIPDASGWVQVESFPTDTGSTWAGAAAANSERIITVGFSSDKPTAWISTDGEEWTDHVIAQNGDVWDVAVGDTGYVAVGTTCSMMSEDVPCDPAVWVSSDGAATWTRVVDDEVFEGCSSLTTPDPGCQTWIDGIATTDTGFYATGYDIVDGTPPNHEVAWTSSDGLTWQRIYPPPETTRPPYPQLVTETEWQNGRYGLGAECTGDETNLTCQPFGWTSPDGTSWVPITLDTADFATSERAALIEDGLHVVSGTFGLLATGNHLDTTTWEETPMMFLSNNGLEWVPYRLPAEMWGVNELVSLGGRVVATSGVSGIWIWTPPA